MDNTKWLLVLIIIGGAWTCTHGQPFFEWYEMLAVIVVLTIITGLTVIIVDQAAIFIKKHKKQLLDFFK